jgi:putative membrane protein
MSTHAFQASGSRGWLYRFVVTALGVVLAAVTMPSITVAGFFPLVLTVVFIIFLNATLRPILVFLALPFVIVTFGIGLVVINALLLLLSSKVVPGFYVGGFWSALWGSLVISAVHVVEASLRAGSTSPPKGPLPAQRVTGPKQQPRHGEPPHRKTVRDDDVIDI